MPHANQALHMMPTRPSIYWPVSLGLLRVPYQPDLATTGFTIELGFCVYILHANQALHTMVPTRPSIYWPVWLGLLQVPYQPDHTTKGFTIELGFCVYILHANQALQMMVPTWPSVCWPAWLGLLQGPYQPDHTTTTGWSCECVHYVYGCVLCCA